jgi:hypothetical protein
LIAEQKDTYVVKLRVRGGPRDALSLRMPFDRALSAIELQPSFLPPSAIAFIRQLRDPKPGLMQTEDGRASIALEWGRAVAAAVEQVLRRAARPAAEPVPANAEAVFFADRAELLACLAADWCDGTAITRWWWKSLFRSTDISSAVIREWLQSAEYIPAALGHLARRGLAVSFVRAIDAARARAVLCELVERFALGELAKLEDAPAAHVEDRVKADLRDRSTDSSAHVAASQVLTRAGQSPFEKWASEASDSGLATVQQYLLGIGLMLERAPAAVRSRSFAQAARQWRQAEQCVDPFDAEKARANPPAVGGPAPPSEREADGDRQPAPTSAWPPPPVSPLGRPDVDDRPRTVLPVAEAGDRSEEPPRLVESEALAKSPVPLSSPVAPSVEAQSISGISIETGYGGLFYLINLALFLELYGDFTTPAQPGSALPMWDFVALLGHRLLGEGIESDRVWSLLAQLSGRSEQEAPGKDFQPPDSWRLPADWLVPFSKECIWRWATEGERLRVWHPERFLILDLPLEVEDPLMQLLRETQEYTRGAAVKFERGKLCAEISDGQPRTRWLDRLVPYVRARLNCALGLTEAGDLSQILCAHRARVSIAAGRLDIFFALEELPIEIRLAGLDRDPGWVPATGRFIAFHFE